MASSRCVVENDYYLTLRLQDLFFKTVNLQAMFDNLDAKSTGSKDERRELSLRLKAAHDEISEVVHKIRLLRSDAEPAAHATPHTISVH